MNSEKLELSKKLMLEALKEYRGLFNKSPNDKDLELYVKMLCPVFEFKQVTWALTEFVKKGSAFFPSCGEIFAQLKVNEPTKEDKAPLIVLEILQAIRLFSQYDELKMIETLSEDARLTLLAIGGTSDLRNSDHDNIGTTKAQLERAVKGILASKSNAMKNESLERIGISTGKVLEFKTVDYSGFLPDEPA